MKNKRSKNYKLLGLVSLFAFFLNCNTSSSFKMERNNNSKNNNPNSLLSSLKNFVNTSTTQENEINKNKKKVALKITELSDDEDTDSSCSSDSETDQTPFEIENNNQDISSPNNNPSLFFNKIKEDLYDQKSESSPSLSDTSNTLNEEKEDMYNIKETNQNQKEYINDEKDESSENESETEEDENEPKLVRINNNKTLVFTNMSQITNNELDNCILRMIRENLFINKNSLSREVKDSNYPKLALSCGMTILANLTLSYFINDSQTLLATGLLTGGLMGYYFNDIYKYIFGIDEQFIVMNNKESKEYKKDEIITTFTISKKSN
ncbi:MAG: hypothetical protein GY830_07535 [Bacteroidetes bacterium]|nr:hypothetical protein [Bacteroidota bacterium]